MRRRLGITIVVVALSMAGAATVAQATKTYGFSTPVAVAPAQGTPTTTFTIRFSTPVATGSTRGLRSWETLSVADRRQASGSCENITAERLPSAAAHHRISVRLPAATKNWCTGSYVGTITLYRSIICNPGPAGRRTACPEIAFAPEPIGRFRFRVATRPRSDH